MRVAGHSSIRKLIPYILIFPALFFVVGFLVLPIGFSGWMSFNESQGGNLSNFVGLKNYKTLFNHPWFIIGLKNTFIWAIFVTSGSMLISFTCALLLDQEFKGRSVVRNVILLPWMVPVAASAVAWSWIFNGDFGLLSHILSEVFHLRYFKNLAWLGNTKTAFLSVMFVEIWRKFPFYTLSILAAMQSVPTDLYESAEMDGASFYQRVTYITIPSIKPVLMILLLLNLIWTFQAFTTIYLLTYGGPLHSSEVIGTVIYWMAFMSLKINLAAAFGVITLILLLIVTLVYVGLVKSTYAEGD